MEILMTICLVLFLLALMVNAYAHDAHEFYLTVITDWIMLICLASLAACLVVYAFKPFLL